MIAGKQKQRIFQNAAALQAVDDFTYAPINLLHGVAIISHSRRTLKSGRSSRRIVWIGEGKIEKEGLARVFSEKTQSILRITWSQ